MQTETGDGGPTTTRTNTEAARTIATGYKAAHLLAAHSLQKRARAAQLDDSSTDMIRDSLYLQAESEDTVAAQFGDVVNQLDLAVAEQLPQRYLMGFSPADAGVWAPSNEDES